MREDEGRQRIARQAVDEDDANESSDFSSIEFDRKDHLTVFIVIKWFKRCSKQVQETYSVVRSFKQFPSHPSNFVAIKQFKQCFGQEDHQPFIQIESQAKRMEPERQANQSELD